MSLRSTKFSFPMPFFLFLRFPLRPSRTPRLFPLLTAVLLGFYPACLHNLTRNVIEVHKILLSNALLPLPPISSASSAHSAVIPSAPRCLVGVLSCLPPQSHA